MTPMTTPEDQAAREIAGLLSDGFRKAIVDGKWNIHPYALAMLQHGLATSEPDYFLRLTPLGLAVRSILSSPPESL